MILDWVSFLAYPNLFGIKCSVVVVVESTVQKVGKSWERLFTIWVGEKVREMFKIVASFGSTDFLCIKYKPYITYFMVLCNVFPIFLSVNTPHCCALKKTETACDSLLKT
jgi:hypothetical protein